MNRIGNSQTTEMAKAIGETLRRTVVNQEARLAALRAEVASLQVQLKATEAVVQKAVAINVDFPPSVRLESSIKIDEQNLGECIAKALNARQPAVVNVSTEAMAASIVQLADGQRVLAKALSSQAAELGALVKVIGRQQPPVVKNTVNLPAQKQAPIIVKAPDVYNDVNVPPVPVRKPAKKRAKIVHPDGSESSIEVTSDQD